MTENCPPTNLSLLSLCILLSDLLPTRPVSWEEILFFLSFSFLQNSHTECTLAVMNGTNECLLLDVTGNVTVEESPSHAMVKMFVKGMHGAWRHCTDSLLLGKCASVIITSLPLKKAKVFWSRPWLSLEKTFGLKVRVQPHPGVTVRVWTVQTKIPLAYVSHWFATQISCPQEQM